MNKILISTQDQISGFKITKTFGLVYGNVVRSTNVVRSFIGGIRTIFGGEIPEYTKVVQESRDHALDRMEEHAISMGANAVVGVSMITSEVMTNCSEIVAYGTAVYMEET